MTHILEVTLTDEQYFDIKDPAKIPTAWGLPVDRSKVNGNAKSIFLNPDTMKLMYCRLIKSSVPLVRRRML